MYRRRLGGRGPGPGAWANPYAVSCLTAGHPQAAPSPTIPPNRPPGRACPPALSAPPPHPSLPAMWSLLLASEKQKLVLGHTGIKRAHNRRTFGGVDSEVVGPVPVVGIWCVISGRQEIEHQAARAVQAVRWVPLHTCARRARRRMESLGSHVMLSQICGAQISLVCAHRAPESNTQGIISHTIRKEFYPTRKYILHSTQEVHASLPCCQSR